MSDKMFVAVEQFRAAMSARGLEVRGEIIADGELQRCAVNGDRDRDGWYLLHVDDHPAGEFGCWKRHIRAKWKLNSGTEWTDADREAARRRNAEREQARAAERVAAAALARGIFAATSAVRTHPYCDMKGITPPVCVRSITRVALAAVAPDVFLPGAGDLLVVPVSQWGPQGEALTSLQFIAAASEKRFLEGGSTRAGFCTIGGAASSIIAIAEGLATAASVHAATGWPTVIAFYASNLQPVAQAVRAQYPAATIVIAADRDDSHVGETCGVAAATAVRGLLAVSPVRSDWNDLQAAEGVEGVAAGLHAIVERASRATSTPKPDAATGRARLTFIAANDLIGEARPVEIIEGVAWTDHLSVLVSESGTGKTFVLLDAAAAVSNEPAWHGRAVLQGSVTYLSYEGDALSLRLRALREKTGRRLEHVYVLRAHDPLSPHLSRDGEERSIGEISVVDALTALATKLKAENRPAIRLIVIDTVRASLSGSEDNSEHVAAYLRAIRRIMAHVPGAAAILAHHAGWQDGENQRKRERGSSAWRGNADATLYLEAGEYDAERGEAPLTLRTLKVRDAERPAPLHLTRRRVELLEMDQHGEPVTSCIIERDCRSREDRQAEQQAAVDATHHTLDLAVLRAMRDYPAATSIKRLRAYVGLGANAVSDAVARILRARLALEGKRGQPYTLTEAGLVSLNGGPK